MLDSKENRGRYVSKYFEKGIGQELLESYGKKSFLFFKFKKPEIFKFITFEETENILKHNEVLYETEVKSGKIFKNGELLENRIKYKK